MKGKVRSRSKAGVRFKKPKQAKQAMQAMQAKQTMQAMQEQRNSDFELNLNFIIALFFLFILIPLITFSSYKQFQTVQMQAVQMQTSQAALAAYIIQESYDDVELILNKQDFLPYETLQLEVNGNFESIREVKIMKEGLTMPINFYFERINTSFFGSMLGGVHYFGYAMLNLNPGRYNLSISLMTARGLKILQKEIIIRETTSNLYASIFEQVKDKWIVLNARELIYASQSVSGINKVQDEKALAEIINRVDHFNDLEKALTLLVFSSENESWLLQKTKLINYLLAIQDNNLGSFRLIVRSIDNFKCSGSYNSGTIAEFLAEGEKSFNLNMLNASKLELSLDCYKLNESNESSIVNASAQDLSKIEANLTKVYFGITRSYALNKSLTRDNEGIEFIRLSLSKALGGINDDIVLTSIAKLAFIKNNVVESLAEAWLKQSTSQALIKHIALAWLNNAESIEFLLSKQESDGSLPAEAGFSKAELSCLAYKGIPTKSLIENWAKSNFYSLGIKDKAACLDFVFEKEAAISIMPALIKSKTGQNFTLSLSNHGIVAREILLRNLLLNLNYTLTLEPNQVKNILIGVPAIAAEVNYVNDKLEVLYVGGYYQIPLIIEITKENVSNVTVQGPVIESTEQISPETKKEEKTEAKAEELTIETVEKIELNLSKTSETRIKIKNTGNKSIKNILLWSSASLFGVVKSIEPSIINELKPGEEKEIIISFTPSVMQSYEGSITIEGIIDGVNYKKEIEVRLSQAITGAEGFVLLNCSQLNGTICKANEVCDGTLKSSAQGPCCVGKCKAKSAKSKKLLGLIFVLIAIIVLAAAIILTIKRKPKQRKIEEVIKRIEEREAAKKPETKFEVKPAS